VVKTNAPSEVTIAGKTIKTNALPDPFDELDLQYRPRLKRLPDFMDQRAGQAVLDQVGESCTGHAVAALIDTVLAEPPPEEVPEHGAPRKPTTHVSPYMLYAMARKYDEFPGQADVGSSLRGAFKGWYHHGVCSEDRWPATAKRRNLDNPAFIRECMKTPLGAYYRVSARRIDDMQSAITELGAIAASAAIHEGWRKPGARQRHGKPSWVIDRSPVEMGGHAFLIAGYNDDGFLVQNSWGTSWGHNGYATLRYDDWLDNGYDAWVGRPGVPQLGGGKGRRQMVSGGRTLVAASGPDLVRLKSYVIDVTAGGMLSSQGKVTSSPTQIDAMAVAMEAQHDAWITATSPERRVVLYAHGGLVGEAGGIAIADRMIDWWKANHIYPIHIVWESDPITTIFKNVAHQREGLPSGGLLDGAWEALDTALEGAGRSIRPLWERMKTNAKMASDPLLNNQPRTVQPGVTLFIEKLADYWLRHPELEVHLVGHSAGSVVLGAAVKRLFAYNVPVDSLQLMGGAIRADDFVRDVVPRLATAPGGDGMVRRFAAYDLHDGPELDDVCPGPPAPAVYHKSLLYFVARSLEQLPQNFEVPMVGLEKSLGVSYTMPDGLPHPLIAAMGGPVNVVLAPNSANAADSRSKAHGHGEFDDDPDTMTSVVLRIRKSNDLSSVVPYPKGGMPSHIP
jgi:Papain family cysteine protease